MKTQFCENPACSRPFQVNAYKLGDRQAMTSGVIACPHCETRTPGDAGTVFLTHALARDEENRMSALRSPRQLPS